MSQVIFQYNSVATATDQVIVDFTNLGISGIIVRYDDAYPNKLLVTNNIDSDISNLTQRIRTTFGWKFAVTTDFFLKRVIVTDLLQGAATQFIETLNNTSGRISVTIQNDTPTVQANITAYTLIQNATDAENLYDIELVTNLDNGTLISPIIQQFNTSTFTITGLNRNNLTTINHTIRNDQNSSTDSEELYIPKIVNEMFNIQVLQTPAGAVVTAVFLGNRQPSTVITYSLDGVTYSNNNSYSGLANGNYTFFIKDNIGGALQVSFTVDDFVPNVYTREAIFEVSNNNQLITVLRDDNPFNPVNTLSYEDQSFINRQDFVQLFQNTDGTGGVITEQFKTSYANITIEFIDKDENKSIIVPTKKSDNIGVDDYRDITLKNINYFNVNYVGVQFIVGNIYDSIGNVIDSYVLNGLLPLFVNVEDSIEIQGLGWRKIIDIIIVDGAQTVILDMLSSNATIDTNNVVVMGHSVYNRQLYELYEFSIDLTNLNGFYHLEYTLTDPEFTDKKAITEWFNVSTEQLCTYLVNYYNSENNETNFSTGIRYAIRVPYETTLTYGTSDTQDVYITDTNAVSVEASTRDIFTLETIPLPLQMVRKLSVIFSNDRIFINGMSVLKNGEYEFERYGTTNEYIMRVELIRADYAFVSTVADSSLVLPSGNPLAIDDSKNGFLLVN